MFEMLLEENGEVTVAYVFRDLDEWKYEKNLLRHLKTVAYRQETWYRFSVWHFAFTKSQRRFFLANRV